MLPILWIWNAWGLVAVRLAVGAILLVHGWPKFSNLKKTAESFSGMGFKPGKFWGPLVAVAECFGGIALLIGFMTQIVAGALALEFVTILMWRFMKKSPFVGGYEFDLIILAALVLLFLAGAGPASLDALLFGAI